MEKDNVFPFNMIERNKRNHFTASTFLSSDKSNKDFMVAKLFEHHNLMVDILWNQRKDIDELTKRVECLEKSLKGE